MPDERGLPIGWAPPPHGYTVILDAKPGEPQWRPLTAEEAARIFGPRVKDD